MEFLKPHQSHYLKRLSVSFLHTYSSSELRQASSLPTVCVNTEEDGAAEQLHRQRIEAELEILTTQTLARSNKRRSKYQAVTIPSSVKHQVTETAMARPRSPQRKNEVDHEYLQGLLDEQLAVIKQQLVSACDRFSVVDDDPQLCDVLLYDAVELALLIGLGLCVPRAATGAACFFSAGIPTLAAVLLSIRIAKTVAR